MTVPNTPPTTPLPTPPADVPPTNVPPVVVPDATIPPSAPTTAGGGDGTTTATEPTGTEAPTDVPEWGDDFDPARAWQTIKHLRGEKKKTEADLAAERKRVEAFEREKMSDAEKLQADLDAANQRLADIDAANAAAEAEKAAQAAFDGPAAAAGVTPEALATARRIAGEVGATDESGKLIVDDTLFASLKQDHGYLFVATTQPAVPPRVTFGAATSQGPGGSPTKNLTADQVAIAQKAGIDPEDFAKYSARGK